MPVKRFIFCLIALCLVILPLSAAAKDKNVGSVSGKVHKNSVSGTVLSGVEVKCGGKSDKTDSKGEFKLEGIKAGSQTISFSKQGYESFQTTVPIAAGHTANMGDRWLTEIQATGSISGKVHKNSASGAALSGAEVKCGGKSDTTGSDGKFKLEGIKAGNQSISFSKQGYESFQTTVPIAAGHTANMGDRWLTEKEKNISAALMKPELNNSRYKPNLNSPAYVSNINLLYKSGFWGQCTWFALGRAIEVTGKDHRLPTNNAFEWWETALERKINTGSEPKTNSIVVWSNYPKNKTGHVAYVEEVLSDGRIILNEANYKNFKSYADSGRGGGYDNKTCPKVLSKSEIKTYFNADFKGYIYLD